MKAAIQTQSPALSCHEVTVEVPGRTLVKGLTLDLPVGSWLAVLGKNGAGKTLTLETLCGLRPCISGDIRLGQLKARDASSATLARQVTMVTQAQDDAFENSVIENVVLGRYPHLNAWARPTATDYALAESALAALELAPFAARDIRSLSGGERQRAAIAQALVQDTPVLLLDEPISQLDPAHQQATLELFRQRVLQGRTLVTTLHDINAALQFASHALLLFGDGNWAFGETQSMLTEDSLSTLYDVPVMAIEANQTRYFVTRRGS